MKPYQFYGCERFPALQSGQIVRNTVQLTFSGEGEDVETSLLMENPHFEGSLGLVRVKSQIKHETFGFIKKTIDNERQRIEFSEYLQPVDFPAYYDSSRALVVFQAPKKVCRGVVTNLRATSDDVVLREMAVDFVKVLDECRNYFGAWFRGVSSRVRAAGLTGDQIQDDALFKKLLKIGELSNVTIPWVFGDAEHKIMVTGTGAVVFLQDYKANLGLELQLAMDVHDRLLTKVWEPKKSK